ncbi:hypothetical protein HUU42_01205 [bacterium]|nr:hypothetical protein [bacterium]
MKTIMILLALALYPLTMQAQDTTQDETKPREQRMLVELPTAGVLSKGEYEVGMRLFANGGVLANIGVGMTNRFMFGISYGGENFVGSGSVDFNPLPGVEVRYRLIDESLAMPAITIGFNSQGYGRYIKRAADSTDRINRYTQKSRGLFAVASKNYSFMGNLGFHGGINWAATEKKDKDNQPTFFVGLDKSLNDELSVVGEYDFAINDNKDIIGHGRGYLNLGAKLSFSGKVMVEFMLKDVLNNSKELGKFSREIRLTFNDAF